MKRIAIGTSCALLAVGAAWLVVNGLVVNGLVAHGVVAQETLPLSDAVQPAAEPTIENQYSYAIGLDMANSFRSSDTPLDIESLVAGLQDGMGGAKPKYDQATCTQALQQLQMRMRNKAMARQQLAGAENRKLGDAFLAKNKTNQGVKVTKSGLQYKVIQAGSGATPGLNDTVRCNYRGTLIDGREFDANDGTEFPVQGVISGWTEALQLMKVGAKWQLFIPADLAYGNDERGPLITPGSTLVFDIELVDIVGK